MALLIQDQSPSIFCNLLSLASPDRRKKTEGSSMESEEIRNKDEKFRSLSESEISSLTSAAGLARQGSVTKNNCLCAPSTHAGSFRCRLHRTTPTGLQRTQSIESVSVKDSNSKANTSTATETTNSTGSTVEAP